MQLAPIPSNPGELTWLLHESCLFILAQDWLQWPAWWPVLRQYTETPGNTLIVDQGAYELGEPVEAAQYQQLLAAVQPNIAIAPDWLGQPAKKTRDAWGPFQEFLAEHCLCTTAMYVPQGERGMERALVDEYWYALMELEPKPLCIGISILTAPIVFGDMTVEQARSHPQAEEHRLALKRELMELHFVPDSGTGEELSWFGAAKRQGVWLHMLGWGRPLELAACYRHVADSIDSHKPMTWTADGCLGPIGSPKLEGSLLHRVNMTVAQHMLAAWKEEGQGCP